MSGPVSFLDMPHLREPGFETGCDDARVAGGAADHRAPAEPERCSPARDERDGAAPTSRSFRSPQSRDDE